MGTWTKDSPNGSTGAILLPSGIKYENEPTKIIKRSGGEIKTTDLE